MLSAAEEAVFADEWKEEGPRRDYAGRGGVAKAQGVGQDGGGESAGADAQGACTGRAQA